MGFRSPLPLLGVGASAGTSGLRSPLPPGVFGGGAGGTAGFRSPLPPGLFGGNPAGAGGFVSPLPPGLFGGGTAGADGGYPSPLPLLFGWGGQDVPEPEATPARGGGESRRSGLDRNLKALAIREDEELLLMLQSWLTWKKQ